jgi:serine/threonine protein kinase
MSDDDEYVPIMVTKQNAKILRSEAKKRVEALSDESILFDGDKENRFPRLNQSEFYLGSLLGQGGFCVVHEISAIKQIDSDGPCGKEARYPEEGEDRRFMRDKCIRNGDARYAIKKLGDEVKEDAYLYMKGVMDLATEAKFLAVVENPHIIRMRAVADCDPYEEGFFIVLDRLYDTLESRLPKWKASEKESKGLMSRIFCARRKSKLNQQVVRRLVVAHDLCCAMLHMHNLSVIYRDLKPENIGFDVRGDVKIFDLGLAKELHDEDKNPDNTYNLTGLTGSLRYMAPEVALHEPYNFTADVYSFGILLWQILSLLTPFDKFTIEMHSDFVVKKGGRPTIDKKWPISWGILLQMCWAQSLKERAGMDEVAEALRGEISVLRGDEDINLDQTRRTNKSM